MSEIQDLHHRFCQYSIVFKGNSIRTIQWFKVDFNQYVRYTGIENIKDVIKHIVEEWIINGKLERNWSPKTRRLHLQSMSLFLDWCVGEGLIEKNVVLDIHKPRLPVRVPKHLSKEQVREFHIDSS